MQSRYDETAEAVRCFVPMLVKKLAAHGYTVEVWRIQVKSGYTTPRNPWPLPCSRTILLHLTVKDNDTPGRVVIINTVLERAGKGASAVYTTQRVQQHTLHGHAASMSAESALAECDRLIVCTAVKGWWQRVGPWCYDRKEEKAKQVAVFKEGLAAAVWAPARVAAWLEAGVELEAL